MPASLSPYTQDCVFKDGLSYSQTYTPDDKTQPIAPALPLPPLSSARWTACGFPLLDLTRPIIFPWTRWFDLPTPQPPIMSRGAGQLYLPHNPWNKCNIYDVCDGIREWASAEEECPTLKTSRTPHPRPVSCGKQGSHTKGQMGAIAPPRLSEIPLDGGRGGGTVTTSCIPPPPTKNTSRHISGCWEHQSLSQKHPIWKGNTEVWLSGISCVFYVYKCVLPRASHFVALSYR